MSKVSILEIVDSLIESTRLSDKELADLALMAFIAIGDINKKERLATRMATILENELKDLNTSR